MQPEAYGEDSTSSQPPLPLGTLRGKSKAMVTRSRLVFALCLMLARTAHAGPVEIFHDVHTPADDPETVVLDYLYGNTGLFLSSDGGASFQLLCSGAIDRNLQGDGSVFYVAPGDAIYVGASGGLWQGDKRGCGWHEVTAMHEKWVEAFAGDPIDSKVTYLVTSNGSGSPNGIFVNDGRSVDWTALGTRAELFINTLHVVKVASGKRFYETAVRPPKVDATADDAPEYLVRVSDDEGKSWTEHEFGRADQYGPDDLYAEMNIRAIDPTNPDRIFASVMRSKDMDDLIYSPSQGRAGTWIKLAQVSKLQAVAVKPDGTVYYGDSDQDSPGLFTISQAGDAPKRLSSEWKVGCLKYDADHSRMYACNDWRFGTVDLSSGAFSPILDMRSAEKFVECPGEQPVAQRCQSQLLQAYCGPAHYEYAPLCSVYDRPWLEPLAGGGAVDVGASAGAETAGAAATTTSLAGGVGGALDESGRTNAPGAASKNSCVCAAPGGVQSASAGVFLSMALLIPTSLLVRILRRGRRRRAAQTN
jgi:hypothetical protein